MFCSTHSGSSFHNALSTFHSLHLYAALLVLAMSLAAFYEASVLSTLTDILSYVQPPQVTKLPCAKSATNCSDRSSIYEQQESPLAPLVSIRWPSLPASRPQLIDALTLHDLLVLLIHAAVLQHGATPVLPLQTGQQTPGSAAAAAQQQFSAASHPAHFRHFLPTEWNSNRSGYRLRYTFSTHISQLHNSFSDATSSSSGLAADPPTVYELRLLLLPMSHYLVIDANMQHVAAADGASSAVSANHKLTLDVLNYVSIDELHGCLVRWQEGVRRQQQQQVADDEATATSPPTLQLSAWVYRDVALLLTAVSNALIKRCMGPL